MSNEINSSNFIRNIIIDDLDSGKHNEIITRFPPEPNGYLHIGHAKSILLNFGLAEEFHGKTHLRFDDTNPVKEDTEYVESIKEDVKWLGGNWDALYFAAIMGYRVRPSASRNARIARIMVIVFRFINPSKRETRRFRSGSQKDYLRSGLDFLRVASTITSAAPAMVTIPMMLSSIVPLSPVSGRSKPGLLTTFSRAAALALPLSSRISTALPSTVADTVR